jgi:hypothetical protein
VAGDCAPLDAPRTVSFVYSSGRLVGRTRPPAPPGASADHLTASSTRFHSGVLFTQQNDLSAFPPGGTSAASGAALRTTGAYATTAPGTSRPSGQTFLYDPLSRLVDGHLDAGNYQLYGTTTATSPASTPTAASLDPDLSDHQPPRLLPTTPPAPPPGTAIPRYDVFNNPTATPWLGLGSLYGPTTSGSGATGSAVAARQGSGLGGRCSATTTRT